MHALIARLHSFWCYVSYSGEVTAHTSWRLDRSSNAETLDLETQTMQNLNTNILACGSVLLSGYVSLLVGYSVLRWKAQRISAGRPINEIPWWNSFCTSLSIALFALAVLWTVDLAALFADLADSMNTICPLLVAPDKCHHAALDWHLLCVAIGCVAAISFTILIYTTYAEATRTVTSPLERSYPFLLLSCSHCFSAASLLLCVPLLYPAKFFALVGPSHWTSASATFAFLAVVAYTFGTALWVVAAVRVFCRRWWWS